MLRANSKINYPLRRLGTILGALLAVYRLLIPPPEHFRDGQALAPSS
jgi:hypothetical protein